MEKLKVYWQSQNKETQLPSLTEISYKTEMNSTQIIESEIAGTGTAGTTLTGQMTGGTGIVTIFVLTLFLLGVLLDRKLNQNLDLE